MVALRDVVIGQNWAVVDCLVEGGVVEGLFSVVAGQSDAKTLKNGLKALQSILWRYESSEENPVVKEILQYGKVSVLGNLQEHGDAEVADIARAIVAKFFSVQE